MITSVIGAQWGDEGKGRIVDYLASNSDMAIRYQGGDNAGHTVENEFGKFALHIIPSGYFNKKCVNIIGPGCVVNLNVLEKEIESIADPEKRGEIVIDGRAHLIFPFHRDLDGAEESSKSGKDKIGTTKCGIGPCYSDKMSRIGLRAYDLLSDEKVLIQKINRLLSKKNKELSLYSLKQYTTEEILGLCKHWKEKFGFKIKDSLPLTKHYVEKSKNILLEGQLGIMRDIDWGVYPYCTSSSTTVGGACAMSGIPFSKINKVVGVCKSYVTCVGTGPFPTELFDKDGDKLREIGHEFGATTGRPRRCGWLDIVALRFSCYLNDISDLALTKIDVLDDFDEIKVCTAYELDGEKIDFVPQSDDMERVKPVYKTFKGWKKKTSDIREYSKLPANCRKFIEEVEKLSGSKISFVSVGPERDQLIVK